MREACELERLSPPPRASDWLCGAAEFEASIKGDLAAAERHLALALRLSPHQLVVQARYRAAAKALSDQLAQQSLTPVDPVQTSV
jgi:hypothetical protein